MDKIPPTNPPISPNANYFGSFNGRNSQNNQNSKDLSQKFKKCKDFFVTMLKSFNKLQSEEQNNDSTNTITNSDNTAQILIPTNPYGSRNGGNNRLDIQAQGQSTTTEKDGRGDTTTHNGGFTQLFGEKDERAKDKSRESGAMGEGSENLEAGSGSLNERNEIIKELYRQKTKLTSDELNSLNILESQTNQQAKAYFGHLAKIAYKEPYRQNLLSTIENHLKYIDNNPTDTIEIIKRIDIINKEFTMFQQKFPESKNNIEKLEKQFTPLKAKYLPKNKQKSNDDFGIGM